MELRIYVHFDADRCTGYNYTAHADINGSTLYDAVGRSMDEALMVLARVLFEKLLEYRSELK